MKKDVRYFSNKQVVNAFLRKELKSVCLQNTGEIKKTEVIGPRNINSKLGEGADDSKVKQLDDSCETGLQCNQLKWSRPIEGSRRDAQTNRQQQ